jgi:hypothetical protein
MTSKPPETSDRNWPGAGVRVAETGATLPTFQGMPERPVWSGQFRKPNVAWQSEAGIQQNTIDRLHCPTASISYLTRISNKQASSTF